MARAAPPRLRKLQRAGRLLYIAREEMCRGDGVEHRAGIDRLVMKSVSTASLAWKPAVGGKLRSARIIATLDSLSRHRTVDRRRHGRAW